jgi:hypothetical protein
MYVLSAWNPTYYAYGRALSPDTAATKQEDSMGNRLVVTVSSVQIVLTNLLYSALSQVQLPLPCQQYAYPLKIPHCKH